MDSDFLDGIDDQFQRLMKIHGHGKRNGRSTGRSSGDDRLLVEIMDHVQAFSKAQKEQVLVYIQSLKQKVE